MPYPVASPPSESRTGSSATEPFFVTPPPLPPRNLANEHIMPPQSQKAVINVLLLGETGVGKSTFINAFVNYLKFDSLQQAEQGEPVVLIPVSFLITIGDQFDEYIVNFGNSDSNENHEHQGQSVTQQCQSYVFDLNDRFRLRLIDTPGIGDTRGIDQDRKNIDHILTYINSLSHINAICLLLKPNASRLNIFFRSCIKQLLTYLTPNGYKNIIFCFTNSRTTFYAPGDTGPLLHKMLNDEHLNDIPFQKRNTFCFDSESFRYLAARKCGIDFDDYQKGECRDSWIKSVNESVRLLNFIETCVPYNVDEWISPRKAYLDISMLARPAMEALRLIIFNWNLNESKSSANQIMLTSDQVSVDVCVHCAQTNIVAVGPFWIVHYQPSPLGNKTNQRHRCYLEGKQFLIECITKHVIIPLPAGLQTERWQSSFHNLLFKCDQLQHYLRQQEQSTEIDLFQPIIEQFLEEERQISKIRNINSTMNKKVYEILNIITQERQRNSRRLVGENETLSIDQIYEIIDSVMAIATIKRQVDNIKATRQIKMRQNEHNISANIIKSRAFV